MMPAQTHKEGRRSACRLFQSLPSSLSYKNSHTQHLTFGCFAALVGPGEASVSADQGGEPHHPLPRGQVLCCRSMQTRRGDHPLPILPSSMYPPTQYSIFTFDHPPVQVKLDILQGRLPVPQELATELAALALQCKPLNVNFSV